MRKLGLLSVLLLVFAAPPSRPTRVLLNGRPFVNAVFLNGQWAVSLEDFAKAGGGTLTLEPNFQLHGNTLTAISSGGGRSMDKHKIGATVKVDGSVTPAPEVKQSPVFDGIKHKVAPGALFHVANGGIISSKLFMANGKTYIPLTDIARAFGAQFNPPVLKPGDDTTPTETLSLNFTKVVWTPLAQD